MKEPITDISKDKSRLNLDMIHQFVTTSYWAEGRTMEAVQKCIENSICYGMYSGRNQIGFARVITDKCVFAYIMDVIVFEKFQGKGCGKKLVNYILNDPELKEVEKWCLKTKDAHKFYQSNGFLAIEDKENWMVK